MRGRYAWIVEGGMWNEKCVFARKDLRGRIHEEGVRSKEEGGRRNVKARENAWNVEGGMWNEKCERAEDLRGRIHEEGVRRKEEGEM